MKINHKLLVMSMFVTALTGCRPDSHEQISADKSADSAEYNTLLVRAALAENVYSATAVERTVYPKDFLPNSSVLNDLGTRRVEALAQVCKGATGRLTIVRGDEGDEIYAARIATVKQRLADAGVDLNRMAVGGGNPGGSGESSEKADLVHKRMLNDYTPKIGGDGSQSSSYQSGSSSMNDSYQKGQ